MKSVIITGSTKGIGLVIARTFHKNGFFVVLNGRSATPDIADFSERTVLVEGDVADRNTHQKMVSEALRAAAKLDVYINCAGISIWKPIEQINDSFWNKMIDTNLKGTMWGCQAAAAAMNHGGSIINISSLAGKRGSANNSVYCASKFGVNGLTQSYAKELGSRQIRVNAVCPVYVETATLVGELAKPDSPAGSNAVGTYLNEFASMQAALKRLPRAEEIAEACLFLSSEGASAITGQCINVDCGVLPQ